MQRNSSAHFDTGGMVPIQPGPGRAGAGTTPPSRFAGAPDPELMPRCGSCGQPVGYWTVDRVTGLLDRWGLDERAPELLADAAPRQRLAGVFFVDLDHFKRINDSAGHLVGDRLLRAFADVLRTVAGPDDVLARFGGDEFVLVCTVPSRWHALAVARRIRSGARELATEDPSARGGCTASIGLATRIPSSGADFTAMLVEADTALLAAKRHGRDHACVADPERHGGEGHRPDGRAWIMDPPALDLDQQPGFAAPCRSRPA